MKFNDTDTAKEEKTRTTTLGKKNYCLEQKIKFFFAVVVAISNFITLLSLNCLRSVKILNRTKRNYI